MERFFNADNAVWRFIGNLADVLILSVLWLVCSIPVVTIGASTTALYYVTLKLASNQEGYTVRSFFRAFRSNFKQATVIWMITLVTGIVIYLDFVWCLIGENPFGHALIPAVLVIAAVYLLFMTMIFPLLARCENRTEALMKMAFALCIRNAPLLFSAVVITAVIFYISFFHFWILAVPAPGLSAFLNSYIINRIFERYHLNV